MQANQVELPESTAFHEFLAVKRFDPDAEGRRVQHEVLRRLGGEVQLAKVIETV